MQELPTIPREEFECRRAHLQHGMAQEGIDLLVVNSNDRMTAGQANVRYLCDFAVHFESASCLLPREGHAVLVVGPESEALAALHAKIDRIVIAEEYAHPEEDYPWADIRSLEDVLQEMEEAQKRPIKRVGIIGQEFMEQRIREVLSSRLDLLPVDHLMTQARSIKSESEIRVLEYTYRIAEAGMRAALGAIREGVREYEVAAEAEHAMRIMGSEGTGIDSMVASGAGNCRPIIARTTSRKIGAHELVWLTFVPKYQGYHAAVARPVAIGRLDGEISDAVRLAQKAQESIVANLKPGRRGREVEHEGRKVMAEKGLDRYFAYIGVHSVGMIEFEPPIFFSKSDEVICENMILSVDVPCFLAPWGGFRLEDGYLVTRDGSIELDSLQRGLIILDR